MMQKLMNSILLHNKSAFRFIMYTYGIAVLLLIFLVIVHENLKLLICS